MTVTVITDHESLKSIQSKVEQPARIARFLDSIKHYSVKIFYRRRKANLLADYLSRPTYNEATVSDGTFPHKRNVKATHISSHNPAALTCIKLVARNSSTG